MTLIKILCKLSQILQGFYFVNMTTFYVLGQKFVKFFFGFSENFRYQKDNLKLTDLYVSTFNSDKKCLPSICWDPASAI